MHASRLPLGAPEHARIPAQRATETRYQSIDCAGALTCCQDCGNTDKEKSQTGFNDINFGLCKSSASPQRRPNNLSSSQKSSPLLLRGPPRSTAAPAPVSSTLRGGVGGSDTGGVTQPDPASPGNADGATP